MYFFATDFGELAPDCILEAMLKVNKVSENGYFADSHSAKAKELIMQELGGNKDAEIHFVTGGTLANTIMIANALRPYQAVIASDAGHISVHETGAIESIGHKIIQIHSDDGKIYPNQIQEVLDTHEGEHMVVPGMVYISNTTEIGSVYTKAELIAISTLCEKNNLYLYCDGARIGSALASKYCDITLADMTQYTDAFYIGGTKNGALVGEAFVIMHPELKKNFRNLKKQRGGLLAKGTIVGIQFEELFKDGLFYRLAQHENDMATKIADAVTQKGYSMLTEPQSNQIFPILPLRVVEKLEKNFNFMRWQKTENDCWAVRFVTSWATSEEAVNALIAEL